MARKDVSIRAVPVDTVTRDKDGKEIVKRAHELVTQFEVEEREDLLSKIPDGKYKDILSKLPVEELKRLDQLGTDMGLDELSEKEHLELIRALEDDKVAEDKRIEHWNIELQRLRHQVEEHRKQRDVLIQKFLTEKREQIESYQKDRKKRAKDIEPRLQSPEMESWLNLMDLQTSQNEKETKEFWRGYMTPEKVLDFFPDLKYIGKEAPEIIACIVQSFPLWAEFKTGELRDTSFRAIDAASNKWEIRHDFLSVLRGMQHEFRVELFAHIYVLFGVVECRLSMDDSTSLLWSEYALGEMLSRLDNLMPIMMLIEEEVIDEKTLREVADNYEAGVDAWVDSVHELVALLQRGQDIDGKIPDCPQWLMDFAFLFQNAAQRIQESYENWLGLFLKAPEYLRKESAEGDAPVLKLKNLPVSSVKRQWEFEVDKLGIDCAMELTGLSVNGVATNSHPPMPASTFTRSRNTENPKSKLSDKTWIAMVSGVKTKYQPNEWSVIDAIFAFLKRHEWEIFAEAAKSVTEVYEHVYSKLDPKDRNKSSLILRHVIEKRHYELTGGSTVKAIRATDGNVHIVLEDSPIPKPTSDMPLIKWSGEMGYGDESDRRQAGDMSEVEANPDIPQGPKVNLIGTVQAGFWREELAIEADFEVMSVPQGMDEGVDFALRVRGDSMDLEFPEGSIVLCSNWTEEMERPIGRFVIAKRAKSVDEFEYTIKQLTFDAEYNQYYLEPRSSNGEYPVLPFRPKGDLPCTIVGVVETAFKNYR